MYMCDYCKETFRIRRLGLMAVVLVYFFVTTAVDLFHNEACEFGGQCGEAAKTIAHNDPCPACMFKAGSNTTEPVCQSAPAVPQVNVVCQPILLSISPSRVQWIYSIVLRGPPSVAIS